MRSAKSRWLLLADIHFKHLELDRITQTAAWITSVAAQQQVRRVVVCGDLLTSRSSQPTHVLSACYRFLASLVHDARVPHVNVVLGNHDLTYRRDLDHATTALDALRLAAPTVQLHWDVGAHTWDGRRVLTLPFREDQSELVDAVAALAPAEAADTVAFAHLAVHRAITQRHVVRPSSDAVSRRTGHVAYHGLMGPGHFSSLARTFTGHFHAHQTILQQQPPAEARAGTASGPPRPDEADLRGSVTYVGSPLQLTWADLWDEQRGVILLDPETLDHEFIVNPFGVGYTTAAVEDVLGDAADPALIKGRNVMLLGDLTRFRYAAARDKLVTLGARSVRSWSPMAPRFQGTVVLRGLGASTPASDASLQCSNVEEDRDMDAPEAEEQTAAPGATDSAIDLSPPQPQQIDIREQVTRYVEGLDLDKSFENSRELLVQVGHRLLEASASEKAEEDDEAVEGGQSESLTYTSIIPSRSNDEMGPNASHMRAMAKTEIRSPTVFNALPRSLTITNFLGIQSTVHLDFGTDIRRGLTFLVGENGSGKSTLVEAIVWCQFGRCLRSGLGANDVVNDKAKRNCSVRMEFDNGYAITRFRKHKEYANRIVVERDGKVLPEFEKGDARSTQGAIDELLGIGYDTYVRTVVLGHESATSFLSSTPPQRRDLILSVLGLEILDRCASLSRRLLRSLDEDMGALQSRLDGLEQTMDHVRGRIKQLVDTKDRLQHEFKQTDLERERALVDLDTNDIATHSADLDERLSAAQGNVEDLLRDNKCADIRTAFEEAESNNHERRLTATAHLAELQGKYSQLLSTKPVPDAESVARPEEHAHPMLNRLLDVTARMHRRLQSLEEDLRNSSLRHSSIPTPVQRFGGHLVNALLRILHPALAILARWSGMDARQERKIRMEHELRVYHESLHDLEGRITEQRRQLSDLEILKSESSIIQQVASVRDITEEEVRDALASMSAENYKAIPEQLSAALKRLSDLHEQRKLHAAKLARLGELEAASRAHAQQVATYEQIIESDSATRQKQETDRDAMLEQMATLTADRELLEFWASAFAQKSRRVSSLASSSSSYTFREFVLEQALAELNTITTQILAILFENSRHGTALTQGMLRSLFAGSDEDEPAAGAVAGAKSRKDTTTTSASASASAAAALDSSLSVDARLSYGKRSGGERKRVDLALFFALLYVGHVRSPHRAHYLLIDEVFDSLDAAGQAAVVRWCDFMAAARTAYIVVITHSEHLVAQGAAVGEGEADGAGAGAVVTARMGEAGVELEMDGRRLG